MKTRWIVLSLATCIAVSLYLRIALPFDNVFTSEYIKFISIDAYWQMANVDKIAPDFPMYFTKIFTIPIFQWLLSGVVWCIGLGNPSQSLIDTVAVYFPPILAALTIVPVYFIGKLLFSRFVGIVAAALIAVLPGEWLGRSLLGFTDHHVAEVLFSTTAFMFFLMAIKTSGKRKITYTALFALLAVVCLYSWTSGLLVVAIMVIYGFILACKGMANDFPHFHIRYFVLLIVLALGTGVYFLSNFELISRTWVYITTSSTITTTQEMRPLFFPTGSFSPLAAWGNFTTLLLVTPVAMGLLINKAIRNKDQNGLFLFIWSLVMLVAALCFRRYSYYFAVNAALLGGFLAWWLWTHINERILAIGITGSLICIILFPCFNAAMVTAQRSTFAPSDAWMGALEWVENETLQESVILAWWDYGYWINREAGRTAYVNPSQDKIPVENTARMFLSPSENYTVEADYIILDYDTIMGKHWAVATWAGEAPTRYSNFYYIAKDGVNKSVQLFHPEYYQGLAVRLYNFNGRAITPTQSTVIGITYGSNILTTVDVYATYDEALANKGASEKLVGTHAFISPVPLEKVDGYYLVYESPEKINGIPAVKIFRKEVD